MKVELKNIGKKYEGREEYTIRGINLEIEDKDFCVILGPSGCGKSTLLRMIAGLNSITEGELLFDGNLMNKIPSKDRNIAMVFQSYALYPHMTVYDNMAFSLSMRKMDKTLIDKRVKEAAKILQIEQYLYSKPSDISGGQRQRVALGRAMVRKPKVFLMDEPLSNLDAKLREHMRIELVKLHKSLETTSIYVTHDQIEAMTMATKIILLNKGIIQQVGTPDDFYNRPNNLFVAKFIGSPTMNIFSGIYEDEIFVSDKGDIKIVPDDSMKEKLKMHLGKKISIGIRPERFLSEKHETNTISTTIDFIESLGKEKTLYVSTDKGTELLVSVPGHYHYEVSEKHYFTLDTNAIHYFDENGDRI